MFGVRVEDPADFKKAVIEAFQHDGPALVEAVVNRTELSMPPTIKLDISSLLPKPDQAPAQAIFSLLVGTLQLPRNAPDAKLSDQILKSGECAAIKLARSSEHYI